MSKIGLLLVVCFSLLLVGCVNQQTTGSSPTLSENWNENQLKLTWVGPQRKTVPSTAISVKQFELDKFSSSKLSQFDYSNDDYDLREVLIDAPSMKKLVMQINGIDFIAQDQGIPTDAVLSYSRLKSDGTVEQRMLDSSQASQLVRTMQESLPSNQYLVSLLSAYD